MKIGIIGTGNMGQALTAALSDAGHEVMLGSRDRDRATKMAGEMGAGVCGGSNEEAAQFSRLFILAVPFDACEEVLSSCGSLEGKVIIDVTNPIDPEALRLTVGPETSGGEEVAKLAPGANVVKAFNTVHAEVVENPDFGDDMPTCFYCGEDEEAKETVAELIEECGLEPIDCGPIRASRYLEAMAGLIVQLSVNMGWGVHNAFFFAER